EDFIGDQSFIQPDQHNTFSELYYAWFKTNMGAIIISIVSFAILILFETKKIKSIALFKYLPGALFVVIFGILMNFSFQFIQPEWVLNGKHLVQLNVINSMSDFTNLFVFPDFSAFTNPNVYIIAFTIAIIASIETL